MMTASPRHNSEHKNRSDDGSVKRGSIRRRHYIPFLREVYNPVLTIFRINTYAKPGGGGCWERRLPVVRFALRSDMRAAITTSRQGTETLRYDFARGLPRRLASMPR